jgi:hypothetical protein
MNKWLVIAGAVVGTLALSAVLVVGRDHDQNAGLGEPWQIDPLPSGRSRILGPAGLVLGSSDSAPGTLPRASTLADVQRLWPGTTQIGIVAAPGETGAIEAFVDPVNLGFIAGKLVISVALPEALLKQMRDRSPQADFMESTTRKYTLAHSDLPQVLAMPISAVSFIPQAQLDEASVIQRFGQPAERLHGQGDVTHLLYPDRGLDVAISASGKELLQYVAPADFARLREPLLKAQPTPPPR